CSSFTLQTSYLQGTTNQGTPALWHTTYNKSNFSFLYFGEPNPGSTKVKEWSVFVGYLYLTADTGCSQYGHSPPCFCPTECPNPWNTISSYLSTEMSYINVGSVTSTIQ